MKWASWAVIGVYFTLVLIYSTSVPAWEAPDENGHYEFVKLLREEARLPDFRTLPPREYHQPPLYYALATVPTLFVNSSSSVGTLRINPAFMWRGNGGQDININIRGSAHTFPYLGEARFIHLARLASVILGGLTVWFSMKTGWLLFPEQPQIGIFIGVFMMLTPQFLFMSGVLNNDSLLFFVVAGASWQTVRALKRPYSHTNWLYVGIWLGFALITKLTVAGFVIAIGLTWLFQAAQLTSRRRTFYSLLAISLPILMIAGWWYVRNVMLYGDPLGVGAYNALFEANQRQTPLNWFEIQQFAKIQFRSFFGVFGWNNLSLPTWYFRLIQGIGLLAGSGLIVHGQQLWRKLSQFQKQSLIFLFGTIILQELTVIGLITQCNASCFQGRYLLPVIGAIMLFTILGIWQWLEFDKFRWVWRTAVLFLALFALYTPFQIIKPAYALTQTVPAWRPILADRQEEAIFQKMIALRGLDTQQMQDQLTLTLYWEAVQSPDFDYSAFVHLVHDESVIAQADIGLGQTVSYLPTAWAIGDIVADQYQLTLPSEIPTDELELRVGIYNWISGERLFAEKKGDIIGDFISYSVTP